VWQLLHVPTFRTNIDRVAVLRIHADKHFFYFFYLYIPHRVTAIFLIFVPISASIGSKVKDIDYAHIDLGIAAEHICLQAADLGLGTCILGWFNEQPIKELLNIPNNRKIGLLISMGYPENTDIRKKIRRPLEQVYSYNKY